MIGRLMKPTESPPFPLESHQLAQPRSLLRRIGCGLGLVIWAVLILSPCAFILIATQRDITIPLGDIPGQALRVWLIEEVSERGIGISTPLVVGDPASGRACVEVHSRFILWMGQGEPTTICECYARQGEVWEYLSGTAGVCRP
jgi:hypothetical protein